MCVEVTNVYNYITCHVGITVCTLWDKNNKGSVSRLAAMLMNMKSSMDSMAAFIATILE